MDASHLWLQCMLLSLHLWTTAIQCLREVIHVKNLLSFGHCPFGGGQTHVQNIWTAFSANCGIDSHMLEIQLKWMSLSFPSYTHYILFNSFTIK